MPLPPANGPVNGRRRVVIEDVSPQIDAGRRPVCRVVGDRFIVTAAIYADGKDELAARVLFRHSKDRRWSFAPMHAKGNDVWSGAFTLDKLGGWRFTLLGWIDHFATWAAELKKRIAAQNDPANAEATAETTPSPAPNLVTGLNVGSKSSTQDIPLALRSGAALIQAAAQRARGNDAKRLREMAQRIEKL